MIAPLAILACLPLAYLSCVVFASLRHGYSWREMDWSNRGHTSIADFLRAADIGRRTVMRGDRRCSEYFAYKDGTAVKITCDAVPGGRRPQ